MGVQMMVGSVEHAGSAAAHDHALLFAAVVGLPLAARTHHLLARLALLRPLLVHDDLGNALLDRRDLLLHDLLLRLLLLLPLLPLPLLLGHGLSVVGLLLLQQLLVDAGQHLRAVGLVGLLSGDSLVLLDGVDEVDEDHLIKVLLLLGLEGASERIGSLTEAGGLLLLLEPPGVVVLPILLPSEAVSLQELGVRVLEEIAAVVDDVLVGSQARLELLVSSAEVVVVTILRKVELLTMVAHELHVVFQKPRPRTKIWLGLLLGVVEAFVYEVLDEGVDEGIEEEGVAEAGLGGGGAVVEAPHAEAEEALPEGSGGGGGLVVAVEGELLLEVGGDVLGDGGVEVLPEVQVVLAHLEEPLPLGVPPVLHAQEVRELAPEVVGVVLVRRAPSTKRQVVPN